MSDSLMVYAAVLVAVAGAWLLKELCPGHPPDPRDDEPHTYGLTYHADIGDTTCEAWCPKCHEWRPVRYSARRCFPSCGHGHDAMTTRGWREIKRFDREQSTAAGRHPDTFVIDFFNLIDRACYGAPVRGSTEPRRIA